MMNFPELPKVFSSAAIAMLAGAALALSGCALGPFQASPNESVTGPATQGAAMSGRITGGQNPINGGKIYLYAAGNSAAAGTYGTGATSLLNASVLTNNTAATDAASSTGIGGQDGNGLYYVSTDASGSFNISNDYVCPGAVDGYPAEVYLLAVGGDSGGGVNDNIALMAALGPCTSASALAAAVPFVQINEITTVAAVWALQQFMSPPSGAAGSIHIGAPSTNLAGLQNAFTTAASLANIGSGQPYSVNSWATPESDRIFTLGDILSYCVNSTDAGTSCSNLYASVQPSGSTLSTKGVAASTLNAPADTIQAAWYLAQFPANIGVAGSCGTSGAAFACIQGIGAPFSAMSASPADWTLAVGYAPKVSGSNALSSPFDVAADGYGNVWVVNIAGSVNGSTGSVVPLAPNGSAISAPVGSYTVGANSGYAENLVAASGITSATSYTRSMSHPRMLTVDSFGNAWLADSNGSYTTTTGEMTMSGGTFTCPGSDTCQFGTVVEFPAATGIGTAGSSSVAGYYTPSFPVGAAADASGNVYFTFAGPATYYGSDVVGKLNQSGAFTSGQTLLSRTYAVAVDNSTTNGPFIWADAQLGCTATAGGYASTIIQSFAGTMAATSDSGLTGGNTGCKSGVHDAMAGSAGLAVDVLFDASNNIWLINGATQILAADPGTNNAMNTVTYGVVASSSSGALVSTTNTEDSLMSSAGLGGMNNPQFGEVDGAGNLWISNYGAAAISEVNVTGAGTASMAINSLSGSSGFQHTETGSALSTSEGLAIDLSGNVWVSGGASSTHYVTVLVGAATPVGPLVPGKYGVAP